MIIVNFKPIQPSLDGLRFFENLLPMVQRLPAAQKTGFYHLFSIICHANAGMTGHGLRGVYGQCPAEITGFITSVQYILEEFSGHGCPAYSFRIHFLKVGEGRGGVQVDGAVDLLHHLFGSGSPKNSGPGVVHRQRVFLE